MKRAHVISLVFVFWQMTKSELVGRRQCHLFHFRHLRPSQCFFCLFLFLFCFPYKTSCKLSLILFYQLNTISWSVLIFEFFSCVCLRLSSGFFTHSSFKHNTFYIWDVLRSYFLIVFSKKGKKKRSKNRTLIFSSWPGYSDCVVYCTFWETILYILAFDSLNYLTLWRTWQIPLEHNEYVKKNIYIK